MELKEPQYSKVKIKTADFNNNRYLISSTSRRKKARKRNDTIPCKDAPEWRTISTKTVSSLPKSPLPNIYKGEKYKFKEGDSGLTIRDKDKSKTKIATFFIATITKQTVIDVNDSSNSCTKLNVKVLSESGMDYTVSIPIAQYYELGSYITKKYPDCILYPNSEDIFKEYLFTKYSKSCLEVVKYIGIGGWHYLNNKLQYLHSGMENVSVDRTLYPNDPKKGLKFLTHFDIAINRDELKSILLLYLLWSYTSRFWYEVIKREGPRSVLWLTGYTNTGKTTIAKVLIGSLYKKTSEALMQFEGTEAAMDAMLTEHQDQLICIDDFYPQIGERHRDFINKANHLVRIVGDGYLKAKMGPNRKLLPKRTYYGGVIVTGEKFDLPNESSITRCIIIEMNADDINKDSNLTELSTHPKWLNAFLAEWITWLQNNEKRIKKSVYNYETHLETTLDFSDTLSRFRNLSISFHTLAHIVKKFIKETYPENQFKFIDCLTDNLDMILESQITKQKILDPLTVSKEALLDAIETGMIKISASKSEFINDTNNAYYEINGSNVNLVITYTAVKKAFDEYEKNHGKSIIWESVKQKLHDKGLLVTPSYNRGHKFSVNRKNASPPRPWMLTFDENILGKENNFHLDS